MIRLRTVYLVLSRKWWRFNVLMDPTHLLNFVQAGPLVVTWPTKEGVRFVREFVRWPRLPEGLYVTKDAPHQYRQVDEPVPE